MTTPTPRPSQATPFLWPGNRLVPSQPDRRPSPVLSSSTNPPGKKRRLGEILLDAGLINAMQLNAALAEQKKWGGKLGRILVEMAFVDEESMTAALSRQLSIPRVDLDKARLPDGILQHLRVDVAERYGVFPLAFDAKAKSLSVATSDPTNVEAFQELSFHTGYKILPVVCGSSSIDRAIRRHYYGEKTVSSEVTTPQALGVDEQTVSAQELIQRSGVHAQPAPPAQNGGVDPFGPTAAHSIAQVELARQLRELNDRLGALEKHAANQVRALRGLFELLVEKGYITRDEYLAKVRTRE